MSAPSIFDRADQDSFHEVPLEQQVQEHDGKNADHQGRGLYGLGRDAVFRDMGVVEDTKELGRHQNAAKDHGERPLLRRFSGRGRPGSSGSVAALPRGFFMKPKYGL